MKTRVCRSCGEELPLESFRQYTNRPGRRLDCLACVSELHKAQKERSQAEHHEAWLRRAGL